MEAERWQAIERLYHSALKRKTSQRAAFLGEACSGDESLRREVEALLAQAEESGSFLESPALEVAAKALAQDQAGVAGAARPTDPMLGATIAHQRAPGRVDYARTPGGSTTPAESFTEQVDSSSAGTWVRGASGSFTRRTIARTTPLWR
jgi:hypothetical protein